jgi:hypothetical protein
MVKEDFKNYLKSDPIPWLLEGNNPSVRYFTLKDILGKPEDDPDVAEAKKKIMMEGPVPTILSKQNEGGYWGKPEDFYIRSKFKGTVWSFILLGELGADGRDRRIRESCEFILENSRDRESGAYSYKVSGEGGGEHLGVVPCLTGNMLWGLIRFGYFEDPRVQQGIEWILNYQRCDDRNKEPAKGWPYDKFPRCWGRHSCHMGVEKLLRALAEIPQSQRSPTIEKAIQKASEYFLIHHIYKRSHKLERVAIPGWVDLGFPLMYQADALEVLLILTQLGYLDPRMQEAVDLVVSKQNEEGKWLLERTYNGRMQVRIDKKGEPSKWITLRAVIALKNYYG